MSLKDKYETYNQLKTYNTVEKEMFITDWEQQLVKAQNDGEDACTNNSIYVYDSYYTTYLEESWDAKKDASVGTTAMVSKEWDDYKFLLRVCNDLGLKPYIINVSCNGYYYDHIGVDATMRKAYYEKASEVAQKHAVPIYNGLVDKEYEPYVYADVMHLGWKGWIYVTQAITEHFR